VGPGGFTSDRDGEVRRQMWNELRRRGETKQADTPKGSRWALRENPEDFTHKQRQKLTTSTTIEGCIGRTC
jgi:hypothetical protein